MEKKLIIVTCNNDELVLLKGKKRSNSTRLLTVTVPEKVVFLVVNNTAFSCVFLN